MENEGWPAGWKQSAMEEEGGRRRRGGVGLCNSSVVI